MPPDARITPFEARIDEFIQRAGLLRRDAPTLVALSGGADSTALLLSLLRLGYDVQAAHCNFTLRGAESYRDERFCGQLCSANGIVLHRAHFNTRQYAEKKRISIEMAAREQRYAFFEQVRKDIGAQAIAVAHHKEDSVETTLINLIRGTGIAGLRGIRARRGNVVRPFIYVTRSEIESYLIALQQDYITDSTNLIPETQRNKVRLEVIPLLESINPSVIDNIFLMSRHVAEVTQVMEETMAEKREEMLTDKGEILLKELRKTVSPELTLWYILRGYGFSPAQIRAISDRCVADNDSHNSTGKIFIGKGYTVVIDRDRLLLAEKIGDKDKKVLRITSPGVYDVDDRRRLTVFTQTVGLDYMISRDRMTVTMDADKIKWPLSVRTTRAGDRFQPYGMTGTKLLSDFLTDEKVSIIDKRRQLVMSDATGQILWVVGRRPAQCIAVDGVTSRVVVVVFSEDDV